MDKLSLISLAVLHSGGFSQRDLEKISDGGGNFEFILEDLLHDAKYATPWVTPERREKIIKKLKEIDKSKIEKTIDDKSIILITKLDDAYPCKLRSLHQSPFLIYIRGNLEDRKLSLGIVGSRKNTSYGKKVLETLTPAIVVARGAIISGGAYGIDAIAHSITLEHGGYTISVFGCGIDIYYPVQNSSLFERILAQGGALLSVFPIGSEAEPYMFPVRNEIVAGLSDGIIIPEAGLKSGTLITASLALEQGRDVFAVPGDIYRETSAGTNMLIATGQAKCVIRPEEILEEYFPAVKNSQISLTIEKTFETETEKDIYNALKEGYNTPDLIGQNTDHPIDSIIMTLTLLEIGGHITLGKNGAYDLL